MDIWPSTPICPGWMSPSRFSPCLLLRRNFAKRLNTAVGICFFFSHKVISKSVIQFIPKYYLFFLDQFWQTIWLTFCKNATTYKPMQLCAFNFLVIVYGRMTYGCDSCVSPEICLSSVAQWGLKAFTGQVSSVGVPSASNILVSWSRSESPARKGTLQNKRTF